MKNNFLFVCSVNMLRSPTAEHVARSLGYSADSVGTEIASAIRPITIESINRAEYIICMEMHHCLKVLELAKDRGKDTVVWNIPDDYGYCDPMLVAYLTTYISAFGKANFGR